MQESPRVRRVATVAIVLAWGAGALLRLWRVGSLVLDGDEAHALYYALLGRPREILFAYHLADSSIPLTLLDRLLIDHGVGLSELWARLPALGAGLLLLVLAPLWAWRRIGPGVAVALAWLVALSPALTLYSRIARPYTAAALCAGVAVTACEAWQRQGDSRRGALYVGAALVAVWLHLGSLPLVLTPLLAAAWLGGRAGLRRVAALGACTVLALAFLLVPAHATLVPLLGAKHTQLHISAPELGDALAFLTGMRHVLPAVLLAALALLGWIRLRAIAAPLAGYLALATGGHLVATLAMSPEGIDRPAVLGRYLLLALPLALVALATFFGSPGSFTSSRTLTWAAAVVGLPILVAAGPFLDGAWWRSSFGTGLFVRFFLPPPPTLPATSALYRSVVTRGPGAIVEAPFSELGEGRVFDLYQRQHRQVVMVAVSGWWTDPRLHLANAVDVTEPSKVLASRARWLLVHTDLAEQQRAMGLWWQPAEHAPLIDGEGEEATRRFTDVWGPPDLRGGGVSAWDLARVRRAGAGPSASSSVP